MNGEKEMDLFTARLDSLGPELAAWPMAERQAAEQLLAHCAEARAQHAAASRLHDLLAAPPPPADARLRRAVLDIPIDHPRVLPQRGIIARLVATLEGGWRLATAGAGMALATGVLGFLLGSGQLQPIPGIDLEGEAAVEQELAALLDTLYTLEELP